MVIKTKDGSEYEGFSDILQQIPPLEIKKDRVARKFADLCAPVMGDGKTNETCP
ncbi:MAG: hypothetical protein R2860_10450 [Desulfobacterales bacterium]